MSLIVRNDEQIKVGTTPGLVAGSSSFTFDGTAGTFDYRGAEIGIKDAETNRKLVNGVDYTWDHVLGVFQFLLPGVVFIDAVVYTVRFMPTAQPLGSDTYSFINASFFIRDINLVNVTKQPQVTQRLNSFIEKYEEECLIKILGTDLYGVVLSESSTRVSDLVYGCRYDDLYGKKVFWRGLVYNPDISLIANYVYYWYQDADAKQTTGTGTKAPAVEAGTQVSPADKMVNAWRFFSSEARSMAYFLRNRSLLNDKVTRVYPEFTYNNYCYTMNLARKGGVNKYGF